ncbi:CHAT domain-containing protein [Methyloversatilis thermotolerans]|uniref:CHAT domain-containing protein n=1 Tax=Methyloversatilis thermotolerans TaxID=1346290 RepID=UPI00036C2A5B|nr:CHAT domain-containing protein [Methyloversatilis thermotolerans]
MTDADKRAARPLSLVLPLTAVTDERSARPDTVQPLALPPVLRRAGSRDEAGSTTAAALLPNVRPLRQWALQPAGRSADAPAREALPADQRLLALEAEDGTTVFMRADALAETLATVQPDTVNADGVVDFARFHDPEAASRGVREWIWKRVTELAVEPDEITDRATRLLREKLGDLALDKLEDALVMRASTQGAAALMAAIESTLAGAPGLYRWDDGGPLRAERRVLPGDADMAALRGQPVLLFIHGTASSTLGSFGELASSELWPALAGHHEERVFAFEHRTFSESPLDNALALVQALPDGARLHLVTHSRGGLVGDLLCLAASGDGLDTAIRDFRRQPRPDERAVDAGLDKEKRDAMSAAREQVARQEQDTLRALIASLKSKNIAVERYVRVAAPAAGTSLLSDNLDVFLSCLLDLLRRAVSWAGGAAAGALVGPVAAATVKEGLDRTVRTLARVVVEIANRRVLPQCMPGIEAMLPDSPLTDFLARAPRQGSVRMAVIAGDIEGGGLLKRLAVMFTDWMFFDRANNDLVVDTRSMIAGMARRGAHARVVQGPDVSHFRYFVNRDTREALRDWLTENVLPPAGDWNDLAAGVPALASRGDPAKRPDNTRPVVVLLPGIMASHLEIRADASAEPGSGERIWLDPQDIARRGLGRIAMASEHVRAEELIDSAYGRLRNYLHDSHHVVAYAYDWRQAIADEAARLAGEVERLLDAHPDQPLRLLAHGMGGLLAREMIRQRPDLWSRLTAHPGGRLVMLGTPNRGAFMMVDTLLGRSDSVRLLARADLRRDLQAVLDIVAGFDGALQLLPMDGTASVGGEDYSVFDAALWQELRALNPAGWFRTRDIGARPSAQALAGAREFWKTLDAAPFAHADRVNYVCGQADITPSGVVVQGAAGRQVLASEGTPYGDGSVTWESADFNGLSDERCWLMPVDHGALANAPEFFDDIHALLEAGRPLKLSRLASARGDVRPLPRSYQPQPVPAYPGERELVAAVVGGRLPPLRAARRRSELKVSVRAGDLRFLSVPVLCGHYIGDPIAGAERTLDTDVVDHALTLRERLGVHAGALNTVSLVLMPRTPDEIRRGRGRGALIVGLGEFGELSAAEVRETVRSGVLRLLLHAADRDVEQVGRGAGVPPRLHLASVLIGYNSTTTISVDESVVAITLGVIDANRQFAQRRSDHRQPVVQVGSLQFIEQFEDVAVTAARAVRELPRTLERPLSAAGYRLEAGAELHYGEGVRARLSVAMSASYWPRLTVSDADRSESACSPECYEFRSDSPLSDDAMDRLLAARGMRRVAIEGVAAQASPRAARRYPLRLKYRYEGQRARVELEMQQRQPGLVERLVELETGSTRFNAASGFGRTLFHLLIPPNLKSVAREAPNLMLVVDGYTANLPWEMIETNGEPLVLSTRLIRQLETRFYRPRVQSIRRSSALIIVNPSTEGYRSEFAGGPVGNDPDRLPSLPGAEEEGAAIAAILEADNYDIVRASADSRASDVVARLFQQSYRLLVIAAHGVFEVTDRQGALRSGVVLSDGLLLSAAEVGQMEVVPEVVFLNCCHLGGISRGAGWAPNRLAYSLARELIEMGVRCVVAAGWAVDDAAALTFSRVFFDRFVRLNKPFGEAIHQARHECHARHPDCNTWGAYQAYGSPTFTLKPPEDGDGGDFAPVSPAEVIDWLDGLRLDADLRGTSERGYAGLLKLIRSRMNRVPEHWQRRGDVSLALARLHDLYGEAGFDNARRAYLDAIAADAEERDGCTALLAIELLARLEARTAENLARAHGASEAAPGKTTQSTQDEAARGSERLAEAGRRAHSAVGRMRALVDLTDGMFDRVTLRRRCVLGSVLKSLVRVMLYAGEEWATMAAVVRAARDAYAAAEGGGGREGDHPYATLNRLQLDVVLGGAALPQQTDTLALVRRCGERARKAFADDMNFWDGMTAIDAELTASLLAGGAASSGVQSEQEATPRRHRRASTDGSAPGAETNRQTSEEAKALAARYISEIESLKPDPDIAISVLRQIELLRDLFARASGQDDSKTMATRNLQLLSVLAGELANPL